MEKEKWLTKNDLYAIGGVTYEQTQVKLLRILGEILIDIRTLLSEGKHGKASS